VVIAGGLFLRQHLQPETLYTVCMPHNTCTEENARNVVITTCCNNVAPRRTASPPGVRAFINR